MKFFAALLVFLLSLPAAAQEQEPNNDPASATTIAHGDVIRGDLTPNDNDYFVLTTSGTATLLFYTAQPNGGARIQELNQVLFRVAILPGDGIQAVDHRCIDASRGKLRGDYPSQVRQRDVRLNVPPAKTVQQLSVGAWRKPT